MTCDAQTTVQGTDTLDGTVVHCDLYDDHSDHHSGAVPGTEHRYAWHDDEAVEQPCGHTHAEHVAMSDDVAQGHPEAIARMLAGVLGVPAERIEVADLRGAKDDDEDDPVDTMLRGLKQMEDVHAAILGAAQRHRQACEAAGFSPAAAEGLALQFYMQALGK
jgi:hypothetical protein